MAKEIKIINDWSAWTLIENIAEKSELDVLVEDDNVVSEVENEEKSRGLRAAIFDDDGEGEGWNWDFERVFLLTKKYPKGLGVILEENGYRCPRCQQVHLSDIKDYDVVPQDMRDRGNVFFIRRCLSCKLPVVNFRSWGPPKERKIVPEVNDGNEQSEGE